MGERTWGLFRRRTEGGTRKVVLLETATLTPTPAITVEREDGERRAVRRLKLLAGLLSRGRGDSFEP